MEAMVRTEKGPLLQAEGLSLHFGGIKAVDGMGIAVERGSITGLIGPNGAGKSTLFNLLSGTARPSSGAAHFKGQNITTLPPFRRARQGLLRTFQLSREFARMTVLENLMMAPKLQLGERLWPLFFQPGSIRKQDDELFEKALDVMELAKLSQVRDSYASELSEGQKKLLELARALMVDCELILLDEPGAGVNPALMKTLSDMIAKLNAEHGITFLIVEHDMDLIARLCDPVVVMADGRKLASGTFADIRQDPRVLTAYLGGAVDA